MRQGKAPNITLWNYYDVANPVSATRRICAGQANTIEPGLNDANAKGSWDEALITLAAGHIRWHCAARRERWVPACCSACVFFFAGCSSTTIRNKQSAQSGCFL